MSAACFEQLASLQSLWSLRIYQPVASRRRVVETCIQLPLLNDLLLYFDSLVRFDNGDQTFIDQFLSDKPDAWKHMQGLHLYCHLLTSQPIVNAIANAKHLQELTLYMDGVTNEILQQLCTTDCALYTLIL